MFFFAEKYYFFRFHLTKAEVGSLMWSDIDFDNKCIHINRSLSCQYEYGKKMLRLTEPKTHNSYRKIPFFGEAEEMYLSQQRKVRVCSGGTGAAGASCF